MGAWTSGAAVGGQPLLYGHTRKPCQILQFCALALGRGPWCLVSPRPDQLNSRKRRSQLRGN